MGGASSPVEVMRMSVDRGDVGIVDDVDVDVVVKSVVSTPEGVGELVVSLSSSDDEVEEQAASNARTSKMALFGLIRNLRILK